MNKKELAFSKLAQNCRPLTPEEMEQVSGGSAHYTPLSTIYVTGTRINPYTTSQAAAYYSSAAFYHSIGIDPSIFQVQGAQSFFDERFSENGAIVILSDPPGDPVEGIAQENGFFDLDGDKQVDPNEAVLEQFESQDIGTEAAEGEPPRLADSFQSFLDLTDQQDTPESRNQFFETFIPFPSGPLVS